MTADEIARVVRGYRFSFASEIELQDGLATALREHGATVEREIPVGRGRIDLLVGRVGVEVKTTGSNADVARQLRRYLDSDRINELVLVTALHRHALIVVPGVQVVTLAGAF